MTRITSTLHEDVDILVFILSRSLLLKMRNISDESCRENRKSKNTFYVQQLFFFFSKVLPFVSLCGKIW